MIKPVYFEGIHWTKTFVTEPLDWISASSTVKCAKQTSLYILKLSREIVRQYQSESPFPKDQRLRFENLGKTDKVADIVTHAVRGNMAIY